MRLSVSNIALTPYDHAGELAALAGMGFAGLEVAPSRRWRETWRGLDAAAVTAYRREIEDAGLVCVGLHSLFFDHPELGLFKERNARAETLDFLVHLSGVCRDLGGKTLIWGGGRRRGAVPLAVATAEITDFLGEYAHRTADHGTCLCLEPLGPENSDFVNSALESAAIVQAVNHKAVRVQIDASALVQNGEMTQKTVAQAAPLLVHVHANEPDLGVLGGSGRVDHARFGAFLRAAGYKGFVSLEQKQVNPADPLGPVAKSAAIMQKAYGKGAFTPPDWVPRLEPGTRLLIAGATGGLGTALVKMALDGTPDCVIGAHGASRLFESEDKRVFPIQRRFEAEADCRAAVDAFVDHAGGIDALVVLSGGIHFSGHWKDMPAEDWEKDITVNLNQPFYLARAALEHMRGQPDGGRILLNGNESSLHGGSASSFPYAITKRGTETMVQGLAREGAPHNVLVNAVRYGFIDSGFHERWHHRSPEDLKKRAELVPLKRGGDPQEAAALMLFLMSGWARFITGQMIPLTGGDWL